MAIQRKAGPEWPVWILPEIHWTKKPLKNNPLESQGKQAIVLRF
jgi:hypothetical protein